MTDKLPHRLPSLALLTAATLLAACGGSGNGSGGNAGIEGTGGQQNGVVSGFGSVFVNGIEFDTSAAEIIVNGAPATEQDLRVGMRVSVETSGDSSGPVQSAARIVHNAEISAPISSIDLIDETVTVLEQVIRVNGNTVMSDSDGSALSLEDLSVNDMIAVSAAINNDAEFVASLFERLATTYVPGVTIATIEGRALQLGPTAFRLNDQAVNYSSASVNESQGPLIEGAYVEVGGTQSSGGGTLQATFVNVIDRSFGDSGDSVTVSSVVTNLFQMNAGDFRLNGQPVDASNANQTPSGTTLANNDLVAVSGSLDETGVLRATDLRIIPPSPVQIVTNVDAVGTNGVTVFGTNASVTAETVYLDRAFGNRPFNLSNLSNGDEIYITLAPDTVGEIITNLERLPIQSASRILGPVQAKSSASRTIVVSNITIHVPTSAQTTNEDGSNVANFFATVQIGDVVNATGTRSGNELFSSSVVIEQ